MGCRSIRRGERRSVGLEGLAVPRFFESASAAVAWRCALAWTCARHVTAAAADARGGIWALELVKCRRSRSARCTAKACAGVRAASGRKKARRGGLVDLHQVDGVVGIAPFGSVGQKLMRSPASRLLGRKSWNRRTGVNAFNRAALTLLNCRGCSLGVTCSLTLCGSHASCVYEL